MASVRHCQRLFGLRGWGCEIVGCKASGGASPRVLPIRVPWRSYLRGCRSTYFGASVVAEFSDRNVWSGTDAI